MSVFEKKNQFVSSIDECLGNGVKQGILHLNTTQEKLDGRYITVNKTQKVLNFGSCSYLGLEMDERLKQGAIDAINKYGTQFSSSRAYLSCGQYEELENLFSQMFNSHCLVSATTTLGHLSSIPVLVADNDAVILDHQCHGSMQNAAQLLKPRGVHVEMIRHSNLEALEDKIKELRNKHYRIWYMIDGVYSMYGDYAPIKELYALMDKYQQLHVYIDDAHGMSWTGTNGTGYIASQVKLRPQVYMATSLAKGFGSGGGVLIFQNVEDMRKVKTAGSSLVFSGPVQPAVMGASIVSAKIHLSPEIYILQNKLKERLVYCDQYIREKKLPYVFSSGSPIFYIGLGIPAVGYNIIRKLINKGFYVDLGIFPGVPLKRTGIRLAININMSFEDIKNVIDAIADCFPLALLEEQQSIAEISKHFKMDFSYAEHLDPFKIEANDTLLELKHYTSINEVDKVTWDNLLGDRGSFDWEGCKFIEDTFTDNSEPENNWKFNYYFIYENGNPILATFVTELLCKDDMLSPESISIQIEEERKFNPYYLTSKVMMMGSLLTEGEHLYLDKNSGQWQNAMDMFIKHVQKKQEECGAAAIYLRDIATEDELLRDYLLNKGFVKNDMPDSWIIDDLSWENEEKYVSRLSANSRSKLRKNVIRQNLEFIVTQATKEEKEEKIFLWKKLYHNVKGKNLKLNTFALPEKIFSLILENKNWEITKLSLPNENNVLSSVIFSYKSKNNYSPMFLGMEYSFLKKYNVYRQSLFQVIQRARVLNCKNLFLGMEAGIEKKHLGARPVKRAIYIQSSDNYFLGKLQDYEGRTQTSSH